MRDRDKTKDCLIEELDFLRQRVAAFGAERGGLSPCRECFAFSDSLLRLQQTGRGVATESSPRVERIEHAQSTSQRLPLR